MRHYAVGSLKYNYYEFTLLMPLSRIVGCYENIILFDLASFCQLKKIETFVLSDLTDSFYQKSYIKVVYLTSFISRLTSVYCFLLGRFFNREIIRMISRAPAVHVNQYQRYVVEVPVPSKASLLLLSDNLLTFLVG